MITSKNTMETGVEHLSKLEKEIKYGLVSNQEYIRNHKKFNVHDVTFLSELFLEELLNAVYFLKNWHFRNLNFETPNHAAIDLADKNNRICFQATVTNSVDGINAKIEKTLTSFFKNGYDKDYDKLFIIIASGIDSYDKIRVKDEIKIDDKPQKISPNLITSKNILDLKSLYEIIFDGHENKDLYKIKEVLYKIPERPSQKKINFNNEKYIKRSFTNIKGQVTDLEKLIYDEKRVILLGVGGLGKTTELNYLASKICLSENHFCFQVRLINYANSLYELLDSRCKNWLNVPEGNKSFFCLMVLMK